MTKIVTDETAVDTFGGAGGPRNTPVALVALTANEWNAVCIAVHHGFETVLKRKDVPVAVQSAFAEDIENAMTGIRKQLTSQ